MIYLITGLKRSGKNTFADMLQAEYEYIGYEVLRISFADALREHLSILNPLVSAGVAWNEAIAEFGYDQAKEKFAEMRRLMQVYGTEVVRDRIHNNFWAQQVFFAACNFFHNPRNKVVIVDDCRFHNEWKRFQDHPLSVHLVRITRAGVVSADTHASEQLDWVRDVPNVIHLTNDGPKDDLREAARVLRESHQ